MPRRKYSSDVAADEIREYSKAIYPKSPGSYLLALSVIELMSEGFGMDVIFKLVKTTFEKLMNSEMSSEVVREEAEKYEQKAVRTNPRINVSIQYFKVGSGKWHAEGIYQTDYRFFHDLRDEALEMFRNHMRPGLCDGPLEFIAVLKAETGDERSILFLIQPEIDA